MYMLGKSWWLSKL